MPTVEVNATWRLSRAEFNMPYGYTATALGNAEYVLQDPQGTLMKGTSYGTMQIGTITRTIDEELLAETIEIDGMVLSLKTVIEATTKFFEKWRIEDGTTTEPA